MSAGPDGPADGDEPAKLDDRADSRRRRLLLVGVAALAVVALALGAAALDDLELSSTGGSGGPESPDTPARNGGGDAGPSGPGSNEDVSVPPQYVLAVYVLMVAGMLLVGWQRDVRTVYLLVGTVLFLAIVVAVFADPIQTVTAPNTSGGLPGTPPPNESAGGGGGGSTPGEAPPANALPTSMLLFFGVALGIAAIVGFSRQGSADGGGDGDGTTSAAAGQVADVGDAAGRAADRIDDADLENAVYRAWNDMTDALDVPSRETTTPAEFREAALAAGLPEGAVRDLTAVFREVRYGDAPTTPEREEQAREALREVESAAEALAAEDAETTEADG